MTALDYAFDQLGGGVAEPAPEKKTVRRRKSAAKKRAPARKAPGRKKPPMKAPGRKGPAKKVKTARR